MANALILKRHCGLLKAEAAINRACVRVSDQTTDQRPAKSCDAIILSCHSDHSEARSVMDLRLGCFSLKTGRNRTR